MNQQKHQQSQSVVLNFTFDRTLPVGGYALKNVKADNILWENSTSDDKLYDPDSLTSDISGDKYNAFFKYKAVNSKRQL